MFDTESALASPPRRGRGPGNQMMNRSQPQSSSPAETDQELLSAYLDQELTAAERLNLERRLGGDALLRAELEELRTMRALLRDLDPVPVPRSFALDPAKVARPRPFLPLTWFMQLGTGFAGLALVLLATVQMIAVGAVPASAPAPMAAMEPAPMASEMRQAEATAPAAMQAPAAPAMESAPMAGLPAATVAPAPTAAPAAMYDPAAATAPPPAASGGSGAGAAGGAAGGPTSNSPAPAADAGAQGMGGPPEIDATVDAMQAGSTGAAADTMVAESAPAEQPAAKVDELPARSAPGITLAIGVLLLGVAVGWGVASRRRA
jgi:hypothetical protein